MILFGWILEKGRETELGRILMRERDCFGHRILERKSGISVGFLRERGTDKVGGVRERLLLVCGKC
ncbi:hypothetical protein LguiA_021164 [Lonicera macranthoides]